MKRIIMMLAVAASVVCARADIFSFDFTGNGGVFDFGATTGEITTNGITMNFTAVDPEDPNAVLNAATYFGVNSNDDADTDTVEIGQYITISFSSSLYTSINLQVINTGAWSSDEGYYQIDTGSQIALTGNNQAISPNEEVLGKTLKFASTAGNGISFSGITVEAVPEPATISMLTLSGVLLLAFRRIFSV